MRRIDLSSSTRRKSYLASLSVLPTVVFRCDLMPLQIWLFKPNLRLAYATPLLYTLPKSGSIHAAKVLYKVLTPSERTVDLKT